LFEYEDEVLDTSIDEIDTTIQDTGFITTLNLIGLGRTATATANLGDRFISEIFINNDGSGYTGTPIVSISTAPTGGINATAVAITTNKAGIYSIDRILLTNAGSGYPSPPTITISGGNGVGAAATCSIQTTDYGIISINVSDTGVGYSTAPNVTISGPAGIGSAASAIAIVNGDTQVSSVRMVRAGIGYTLGDSPVVTISSPPLITGLGTYGYNEVVRGLTSGTEGRVKSWDSDTKVLKVSLVGIGTTVSGFIPGEIVVGTSSTISAASTSNGYAIYTVKSYDHRDIYDKYEQNDEIEEEADTFLDFSQSNPFGNY
jgi:hypothetical protein